MPYCIAEHEHPGQDIVLDCNLSHHFLVPRRAGFYDWVKEHIEEVSRTPYISGLTAVAALTPLLHYLVPNAPSTPNTTPLPLNVK